MGMKLDEDEYKRSVELLASMCVDFLSGGITRETFENNLGYCAPLMTNHRVRPIEEQAQLRDALRSQINSRHIEQHARLGWGSSFENCPNVECQEITKILKGIGNE